MTHPYTLRLDITQRHERFLREADQWRLHRAPGKNRQHTPLQDTCQTLLELGGHCVSWALRRNSWTPVEQT
jgi:hypothetical protein